MACCRKKVQCTYNVSEHKQKQSLQNNPVEVNSFIIIIMMCSACLAVLAIMSLHIPVLSSTFPAHLPFPMSSLSGSASAVFPAHHSCRQQTLIIRPKNVVCRFLILLTRCPIVYGHFKTVSFNSL